MGFSGCRQALRVRNSIGKQPGVWPGGSTARLGRAKPIAAANLATIKPCRGEATVIGPDRAPEALRRPGSGFSCVFLRASRPGAPFARLHLRRSRAAFRWLAGRILISFNALGLAAW